MDKYASINNAELQEILKCVGDETTYGQINTIEKYLKLLKENK